MSIGGTLRKVTADDLGSSEQEIGFRAHSIEVPAKMLRGLDDSVHENVCSPYGYKERSELGCGGADKWDTSPRSAFFPVNGTRGEQPT